MSHILILDIGKTNKKAFIFDEDYHIVFEKSDTLPETVDDDGFPCEDISLLKNWVLETNAELRSDSRFQIKATNCSAYGASFVHLDENFEPVTPLYNYLKPFPTDLKKQFFDTYGDEEKMALETSSPVLGFLNSGLQLYWLKHRKPLIYNKIKWSLHLPQYIAFLMGSHISSLENNSSKENNLASEITSIGCHTMLWNFLKSYYQSWVRKEGITSKFPLIKPYTHTFFHSHFPLFRTGIGLHDSSSALIPYMMSFEEPFVLISTGTWCITLNPFNRWPFTSEELVQDCLFYNSYLGSPVRAARYFGGHEHEEAVRKIASDYGVSLDFFKQNDPVAAGVGYIDFYNAQDAYSRFMQELVQKQVASTRLAIGNSTIRQIFVDGGFSNNKLYMNLLAEAFPELEVFAAEVPQASALGAAVAIHSNWNTNSLPSDLIKLNRYGQN